MFGRSVKLFSIFGFRVSIDLSWIVILVLVTWSLSAGVFPERLPDREWPTYLAMGLCGAFGLFISIILHELSHSLVARRYGTPMEGITLFMFGGVAEMREEPPHPKGEFLMAVAGPLASAALAGIFEAIARGGMAAGWPKEVTAVVHWVAIINVILLCFNLVPGFPLDGGRMLRAALWAWKHDLRRATDIASQVGSGVGLTLILLGFLSLLTGLALTGMWWILIGWFIRSAAKQGYQQVLVRQALAGETVADVMTSDPVTVPPDLPLDRLVEDYVYRYHFKLFPVADGDRLAGCITTRDIRTVPREEWPQHTAGEVAEACSEENTVPSTMDAVDCLAAMTRSNTSRLMVVDDGRLAGVISLKDLLKYLSLRLELEVGGTEG